MPLLDDKITTRSTVHLIYLLIWIISMRHISDGKQKGTELLRLSAVMPCHLTSQWALYAGALAWYGCKKANHVKTQHLDKCQRSGRICMQIQPLFLFFRVTPQVSPPGAIMRLTGLSKVSGEPSAPCINWQHDKFSRDQMRFKRSICATNSGEEAEHAF